MARELNGESDRASIILMASVLDDGLIYLLTSKLGYAVDENDLEHIFRFEGPLGTFSSRIEIAILFGFIDNDMFEQLRTVREMRNACAHAQKPMKFSDPALANVGRRMFRPVGLYDPPSGDAELFKLLFINEGLFLYLFLRRGSRAAAYRELIANQPEAVALLPPLPDKWHER
jgi:hypothetical protein